MMQGLLKSAVPMLLVQMEKVSAKDKKRVAAFMSSLCGLYLLGDRDAFEQQLLKGGFPVEWKDSLMKALWNNEDQSE